MSRFESIPVVIKQLAENALDKNNRVDVRFNYMQTLKNIRDFCNHTITKYENRL